MFLRQTLYEIGLKRCGLIGGCNTQARLLYSTKVPQSFHARAAQRDVVLKHSIYSRLVNDRFGKYVLQYLISIDSMDVNYRLYENIEEYGWATLCVPRFSSNVMEKHLTSYLENLVKSTQSSTLKFTITDHILHGDLNCPINDAYGNYVVQALIDIMIEPYSRLLHRLANRGAYVVSYFEKFARCFSPILCGYVTGADNQEVVPGLQKRLFIQREDPRFRPKSTVYLKGAVRRIRKDLLAVYHHR